MKIRFAVTPPATALTETAFPDYLAACESLGFDTLWLSDIPLGTLGDPLVSLCYAAGVTTRLKLGANIVPLGRHPLWLAKQLAQIDRLSAGRLLISLVPGLGQPAERAALGYAAADRGAVMDEMCDLMRRWWSGEAVSGAWQGYEFDAARVHPEPVQAPLEIWFGGVSRAALDRVARIGDGWLTAAATPAEAAAGRDRIMEAAGAYGREVDAEHFGISIPVARTTPPDQALDPLRKRRRDGDVSAVLAVGESGLADLIGAHVEGGLSKFVVRPFDPFDNTADWRGDLEWLARQLIPLQT